MSSTTDNDSLDEILGQVETLLSDPSHHQKPSDNGWRTIDWENTAPNQEEEVNPEVFKVASKKDLIPCLNLPSPVEKILVKDRIVYLKRDDLVRLPESGVSGNKARKLYSLNNIADADFPTCLVSYGGPQSNAMVALAAIVHSKNATSNSDGEQQLGISDKSPNRKRFVYYTKTLPRFLRNQPSGNLFRAQSLGMELVELSHAKYQKMFGSESGGRPEPPIELKAPVSGDSLWVPQGGSCGVAVQGARMLAQEIVSFWINEGRKRPLTVCVPGGTCTTALLLHGEIRRLVSQMDYPLDIQVVVIPCVGDDAYARRQMMSLNLETGGTGDENEIPTVLLPWPDSISYFGKPMDEKQGYFNFGEPDAAILQTAREIEQDSDVNLDLLYGAPSWTIMLRHWRTTVPSDATSTFDKRNPLAGREVMYVHSGGLEGVASQLTRYRYKGLVHLYEMQYPTRR
jgi:1-aminocyclopropane-1-carboxylate deaminase/D-cysteine desulfhydrase-like pyridoxal-dependent ACC family enzyme